MAVLTVQKMVIGGLEATFAAAASAGDQFANDGETFLQIKNGGASDCVVTVNSQVAAADVCAGQAVANTTITVTLGEERLIGPFNQKGFNNSSGQVDVDYSQVVTVTVAAVTVRQ